LITDSNVAGRHLKPILSALSSAGFEVLPIIIPPGERQKNLRRANAIFTQMIDRGIGRTSSVLAFGGGVVGDLAGFVAATFMRGIPIVQIPTTIIAQVDSAIGGKTAVNHPLGKNLIGAFHQPAFVWTDIAYLKTLAKREIVSGIGEIIKYAVIADEDLFAYLEQHMPDLLALDDEVVFHVLERCSEIKASVVAQDEREHDVRIILNFGHTVGHALEAAGKYRLLRHGEAVLLGMMAESMIARRLGLIDADLQERIFSLIRQVPMRASVDALPLEEILRAMGRDKKNAGSLVRFVLPKRIGEMQIVDGVHGKIVKESVHVGR
jgi:3-dehydroquinate synthase